MSMSKHEIQQKILDWKEARQMKEKQIERRCKILYVSHGLALSMLFPVITTEQSGKRKMWVVQVEDIDGVSVMSVHTSFSHNAFAFILWHRDWPIIEDGLELPVISDAQIMQASYDLA